MNPLNRMDIDDFFKPDEIVAEIFRQYPNLKLPIPLEELAHASGILKISPLQEMESDSLEGMVVFKDDKESGVIYFQPHEENIGRQRFTIAHELGHFLIRDHSDENFICSSDDIFKKNNRTVESEANQFAASLLMPNHLLQPHANSQPNLELFKELSIHAQVSFEAFANNFINLYSQPLALVYSFCGSCRYVWKNRAFHQLRLPLKVSKNSNIISPIILDGDSRYENKFTCLENAEHENWLNPMDSSFQLRKQTYFQQKKYAVTLLSI